MAMDKDDPSRCDEFPIDVLVEILGHLPPNSRRGSRLVCRHWRDTVDERTATNLRSRATTLLVGQSTMGVLDEKLGLEMVLSTPEGQVMEVVGTCNGVICLCDDSMPGGAITLANPANGEKLFLPPLPCADNFMRGRCQWHNAYGFAHHQGTGQYKIVRIPCCVDREFHKVQVFTLGEASWRDVATPPAVGSTGARCLRSVGTVSVDGAVYWVADGTERIMSFDLEKECVAFVKPPPTRLGSSFRLAEVDGRLGIVIIHENHDSTKPEEKKDVWVLESARGKQRWRRWYSVEMNVQPTQRLMLPHFTHGERLLTRGNYVVYSHRKPNNTQKMTRYGRLQISQSNRGRVAVEGQVHEAFAYVETNEMLNIYKLW